MTFSETLRRALVVTILTALLTGCGGGASSTTAIVPTSSGAETTASASPSVPYREKVLQAFFPPAVAAQMAFDGAAIGARYDGTPFSTAQYGQCFIEGTADVKDVLDVRLAANYDALVRYAEGDNPAHVSYVLTDGMYAWPSANWIYRYARAATHFMADYGYDAIAFHPDEYHPVLTRDDDTWLFIRDLDPRVGSAPIGTRFYSNRVVSRALTMLGSYNVAAKTRRPPMAQCPLLDPLIEFFYVPAPVDGLGYTPYATLMDTPVSEQVNVGEGASRYVALDATQQQLQLRARAGIIPSPLSNRKGLRVGKWVQTRFASIEVSGQLGAREQGFSYTAEEETRLTYTWGPYGNYVLPLDAAFAGAPAPGTKPVVTSLDHVVLRSADAHALFTLFTDTLGLPAAWAWADYGDFQTGGVQLGNVNLETLGLPSPAASFYGLVFQPAGMTAVLPDLKARGADPGDVKVTSTTIGGRTVALWRNATLQALCRGSYIAYLCEYAPGARAGLAAARQPTPLGGATVVGLLEVVMESPTPAAVQQQWAQALAPLTFDADGRMRFPSSGALRVVSGTQDRLQSLVLQVASLDAARSYLTQKGLLGHDGGTELQVDPAQVQGLDVRLRQ